MFKRWKSLLDGKIAVGWIWISCMFDMKTKLLLGKLLFVLVLLNCNMCILSIHGTWISQQNVSVEATAYWNQRFYITLWTDEQKVVFFLIEHAFLHSPFLASVHFWWRTAFIATTDTSWNACWMAPTISWTFSSDSYTFPLIPVILYALRSQSPNTPTASCRITFELIRPRLEIEKTPLHPGSKMSAIFSHLSIVLPIFDSIFIFAIRHRLSFFKVSVKKDA